MVRARIAAQTAGDADLRRDLVETLYASPLSLAIGAFAGFLISLAVATLAQDPIITVCAIAVCLIAVSRTVSATFFFRQLKLGRATGWRGWEIAYELGAWAYASLLGLLAFASLMRSQDAAIHVLTVSLAAGYAGGISGRNAGRIQIAIGQTCLALLPTSLGLWFTGDFGHQMLAIVLAVMILGMADISRATHRVLVQALRGKIEKSQLAKKFELLARFDNLTGIENRMAMQMRLRDMFEQNRKSHDALAVLWLDLDRFKEINDSLGHMVGDALLCTVVETLREALDGRGHLARFGGDEFVIICPDVDRVAAQQIADDIVEYFQHGMEVGVHNLPVTASIGIAVAPQDGRDADELMQHADLALYEAKKAGRNQAVSFTWSMKERFHRLHEIENGLRRAIENDELKLHFQPLFDVKSGRIAICEALLRWEHPALGAISPSEFIPIAESIGMIGPMTQWVLDKACETAALWPADVRIAVNISPASMKSDALPGHVVAALMAHQLPARRLELEVTESVFLDDDGHTHQMLRDLRRLGLRLVLDDFGTGYSSLAYLRAYRFDEIKVDGSFMAGVHASREDKAIVEAVAHLAGTLEMESVAEGIETEEQLAFARAAGIGHVQGFLMCRPQPGPAITDMIARGMTIDDAKAANARREVARRA